MHEVYGSNIYQLPGGAGTGGPLDAAGGGQYSRSGPPTSGGGGGGGMNIESRVTALETHIDHIRDGISDVKASAEKIDTKTDRLLWAGIAAVSLLGATIIQGFLWLEGKLPPVN